MPAETRVLLNFWSQDRHWSRGMSQKTAVLNVMNVYGEDKADKNFVDPTFTRILAGPTLVEQCLQRCVVFL